MSIGTRGPARDDATPPTDHDRAQTTTGVRSLPVPTLYGEQIRLTCWATPDGPTLWMHLYDEDQHDAPDRSPTDTDGFASPFYAGWALDPAAAILLGEALAIAGRRILADAEADPAVMTAPELAAALADLDDALADLEDLPGGVS